MSEELESSTVASEIREIKKWVRVQGLESLTNILQEFDDTDLVIYNAADGESTTTEIGEEAGVDRTTVSHRMSDWQQLGIVEKDGRQWKHLAPLAAMGIEVPELDDD